MEKKILTAIISCCVAIMAVSGFAATQYVNDGAFEIVKGNYNSTGYIGVSQNLSSLSIDVGKVKYTGLGSVKKDVTVGYFIYTDNVNNPIAEGKFDAKSTVDLSNLQEGQKIGFYIEEESRWFGTLRTTDFQIVQNGKNLSVNVYGYFTNAQISINAVVAQAPSGQPLPGLLATLLLGGGFALAVRFLRRRKQQKVQA